MLSQFKKSRHVSAVFKGLNPAAAGLVAATGITFARQEFFNDKLEWNFASIINNTEFRTIGICAAAFIAVFKFKVNPVIIIILSALAGIILWR